MRMLSFIAHHEVGLAIGVILVVVWIGAIQMLASANPRRKATEGTE
jgi:hypothetical protein